MVERIILLNYQEEIMWRQRSRITWLREGDSNTRFFHQRARRRRSRNRIIKLNQPDGSECTKVEEMHAMATDFYSNLFKSEGTSNMRMVLDHVPRKITNEMNKFLCAPFDESEVKDALFQMFATKAPGPDGFPAYFFQRNWDVCGEDLTRMVLRVLNGDEVPTEINSTFIVLIPKVQNPVSLNQFRPISLCNVVYKIISKALANRLKRVLPNIISEEQSAFIPGRIISDNILVAYECLHFMRTNRSKSNAYCALKLDMMKAYDRVEWSYLEAIMLKLGFDRLWVDKIMKCVTTASFSILFNGERLQEFKPTRGIRQGDPISPYLFLLCAEGLSCVLKGVGADQSVNGIQIARTAPKINHLLFADDCLLFLKADASNAQLVQESLTKYCDASGQKVNLAKSSIFFNRGCKQTLRDNIKTITQVQNESLNEKYLGLPTEVGRSTNNAFKYLKDKVWNKIQGWIEQTLSAGGKEVLIKSVKICCTSYPYLYHGLFQIAERAL